MRRQLLPTAHLHETGIVGIAGKVPRTEEVRALLTPSIWNGVSLVLALKGYSLVSHTMEFKWDHDGVKEGISQTDAELIRNWPGLLFDNTGDYFMWSFSASRKRLPVDPTPLHGVDLIKLALEWARRHAGARHTRP